LQVGELLAGAPGILPGQPYPNRRCTGLSRRGATPVTVSRRWARWNSSVSPLPLQRQQRQLRQLRR